MMIEDRNDEMRSWHKYKTTSSSKRDRLDMINHGSLVGDYLGLRGGGSWKNESNLEVKNRAVAQLIN